MRGVLLRSDSVEDTACGKVLTEDRAPPLCENIDKNNHTLTFVLPRKMEKNERNGENTNTKETLEKSGPSPPNEVELLKEAKGGHRGDPSSPATLYVKRGDRRPIATGNANVAVAVASLDRVVTASRENLISDGDVSEKVKE